MTQNCASCIYGDGERCHWPYEADDNSHDGIWSANVDAPQWAINVIERESPHRVSAECTYCDEFQERDEEEPEEESERCPDTDDMFGGEA